MVEVGRGCVMSAKHLKGVDQPHHSFGSDDLSTQLTYKAYWPTLCHLFFEVQTEAACTCRKCHFKDTLFKSFPWGMAVWLPAVLYHTELVCGIFHLMLVAMLMACTLCDLTGCRCG